MMEFYKATEYKIQRWTFSFTLKRAPHSNSWKKTMKAKYDDGLEWLREIRRKMAKEFNYDPKKAGDFYRKMARRPGVRLYKRENHLTVVK